MRFRRVRGENVIAASETDLQIYLVIRQQTDNSLLFLKQVDSHRMKLIVYRDEMSGPVHAVDSIIAKAPSEITNK